jgi:hypothetical protein
MITKRVVDVDAMADEAIISSPEIDMQKAERVKAAHAGGDAGHDAPPYAELVRTAPDETSQRHGRVAAKSVAVGFKGITGDALEEDISTTMGDVMGELFGAISRTGSKGFYWGTLGLCLTPLAAVIGWKVAQVFWSTTAEVRPDA